MQRKLFMVSEANLSIPRLTYLLRTLQQKYRWLYNHRQEIPSLEKLEVLIRLFLAGASTRPDSSAGIGIDLSSIRTGDEVPETPLTDYRSLGELVGQYNSTKSLPKDLHIDTSVLQLRDAFAHGRVSTPDPGRALRLLKFDKPRDSRVRVTFSELMTPVWLDKQVGFTSQQVARVGRAIKTIPPAQR